MVEPPYTQRNPTRPDTDPLLRSRLKKILGILPDENVKKIDKFRRSFADRTVFWTEVAILDRLHYKNSNQHRSFHRFHRTAEIRRLLKRFKELDMDKMLADLYMAFWNVSSLKQCQGKWKHIPSKELFEYTMHRLISAVLLLDKLRFVLVEVYRDNTTLLRLSHFVSLALVYMGLCSRLYSLANTWIKHIEDCYNMLQEWHGAFPSGWTPEKRAAFLRDHPQTCHRQTLQTARRSLALQTSHHRPSKELPMRHLASHVAHRSLIQTHKIPTTVQQDTVERNTSMDLDLRSVQTAIPVHSVPSMPLLDDDEDLGESVDRDSLLL